MPSVYGGRPGQHGVAVHGLAEIQKALNLIQGEERANYGIAYEMRARLLRIGEAIKSRAQELAPERSGDLRKSIAVSVTQRAASVYSRMIYGGIQNEGGQIGREHRTLLRRDQVSRYMDRAVDSMKAYVEEQTNSLVDWLIDEFESA